MCATVRTENHENCTTGSNCPFKNGEAGNEMGNNSVYWNAQQRYNHTTITTAATTTTLIFKKQNNLYLIFNVICFQVFCCWHYFLVHVCMNVCSCVFSSCKTFLFHMYVHTCVRWFLLSALCALCLAWVWKYKCASVCVNNYNFMSTLKNFKGKLCNRKYNATIR